MRDLIDRLVIERWLENQRDIVTEVARLRDDEGDRVVASQLRSGATAYDCALKFVRSLRGEQNTGSHPVPDRG